ncbi:MAG: sodium-dependent bicarbonate transport family permease [Planctomycetaceae bacterium]|nr:sodium-dependent bicarbonate transport family permease [Planctomycetaceae bacterium]
MLQEFLSNFVHNLFQPLLLFFYLGFLIPLLKVPFEFPKPIYQGITIYLLLGIGWHGGERLATLSPEQFSHALGFMLIGFITNTIIGLIAYFTLRKVTKLRHIDCCVVGGYYGSDSAGTFMTCLGVLAGLNATAAVYGQEMFGEYSYAPYMPVMLAVMEIPGCLVALFQVSRLRASGLMDSEGNMPGEAGYQGAEAAAGGEEGAGNLQPAQSLSAAANHDASAKKPGFDWSVLHEVFLNPGLYLLFGGIMIGFVSALQGKYSEKQVEGVDAFLVTIFEGALCVFLLEMGMTACKRLSDLRRAGLPFVLFGVLMPNVFATFGIVVAHGYSMMLGEPFGYGTYALFAVLCAAASYIAVPAVQRLAVPESSPTLPLAASLGLTFTYNVTIGIPIYILIAKGITSAFPVIA